jgi:aspartyl-tRNA(Asn)/glutamyl-tRNA(Gln) amidotransferase subunit B
VKQALEFIEVSTCDMEKGHLRCDANVSVRLKGAEKLGTKAEVKNLNSFRFLKQALDYEIARQVALIEAAARWRRRRGSSIPILGETARHAQQGTRARLPLFSRARPGAAAHRRRMAGEIRAAMPELPARKRARFMEELRPREYDADVLTPDARVERIFRNRGARGRRSQDRRQLGDGRPDGRAESRRQGDRRTRR